jgi:hypothetical protein
MLLLIVHGSQTEYLDYWRIIDRSLSPSGGLYLHGLITIHDVHPVIIPTLLYWANARLFGGSNIYLGGLVIVITLGMVAIVMRAFARSESSTPASRAVMLVATSFLLFTPAGAWNFYEGMSGAAWLPANVFVALAITLSIAKKLTASFVIAVLASMSYGTGLLVWPVLMAIGLIQARTEGTSRRAPALAAVGGVAAAALYSLAPTTGDEFTNSSASVSSATPRAAFALGGFIFSDSIGAATALGAVGFLSGAWLAWRSVTHRVPGTLLFIGLWLYAAGSLVLMALARADAIEAFGLDQASRYASLAALMWISILGMALLSFRSAVPIVALTMVSLLATTLAGQLFVDQSRDRVFAQDRVALAQYIGMADGTRIEGGYRTFPVMTHLLRALHHYPFDGRFSADCGLFGKKIGPDALHRLPAVIGKGGVNSMGSPASPREPVHLNAWLESPSRIRCVVVLDGESRVVGAGLHGGPTPERVLRRHQTDDPNVGIYALARRGAATYRLGVKLVGDNRLFRIGRG